MKKIILDTNFCIIPFQFGIDIYSELQNTMQQQYEIVFPKIALKELEKLKFGGAALELLKKKSVKLVDVPVMKDVDSSILEYAKKENAILATQDLGLKKKAKENKVEILVLRQKKYIVLM
ncbi:MAG TPA: hypothetical protein ENN30_00690 [Candidatus Woesearchaeota archaeon]|nr:hypothetical protein [Candidatus Woesearchaeota archaeon]